MNSKLAFLPALLLGTIITITACKKDATESKDEVADRTEEQNHASDDMDAVANDVNLALESTVSFSGRTQQTNAVCSANVTVDSSTGVKKLVITYDGADCFGTHSRSGKVIVWMSVGRQWKEAGATVTVVFQNVQIKRLSDNKTIKINGEQHFTNVNGGLLYQLPSGAAIVHTITSNGMMVTFQDSTHSTWNIARKRTFSYDNGAVMTVTGNHTEGTNTKVAEWGVNRFGKSFITSIAEPIVVKQSCNARITSGKVTYEGFATASATFGLDKTGAPTACPGTGNYYYKLDWSYGNKSFTGVFPY